MLPLRLWDISPPVHAGAPVYPADTPYRQRWTATLTPDNAVNVSEITLSPHIGAHADAPLHYDPAGAAIGAVDLAPYLGRCRVIHAIDCGGLIAWSDIAHAIAPTGAMAKESLPPRVLVRTRQHAAVDHWDEQLIAFAPATIERLAHHGVTLIGIDSASIDPAHSSTLESHQAIRRLNLRVLENLVLDDVPEGDYELIALPLKWTSADASPVRAILRELPEVQKLRAAGR